MIGGAFGGGRDGRMRSAGDSSVGRICMSVLGVVAPIGMEVASDGGFGALGIVGCGDFGCCSCGVSVYCGGGGAGVPGTTTVGGEAYDIGLPQAAGLGTLVVGVAPPDMVSVVITVTSSPILLGGGPLAVPPSESPLPPIMTSAIGLTGSGKPNIAETFFPCSIENMFHTASLPMSIALLLDGLKAVTAGGLAAR
jgi:hypothetical protein